MLAWRDNGQTTWKPQEALDRLGICCVLSDDGHVFRGRFSSEDPCDDGWRLAVVFTSFGGDLSTARF